MRFILISTSTSDVSELLADEGARAGQLAADGVFEHIWPKADASGVVVLARAPDEVTLREAADTLPTVVAGATTYEVIPLAEPAPAVG